METKLKFFVPSWTSTFLDFRGIYFFFFVFTKCPQMFDIFTY